jgi:CRISPR-associated protein Cmr4
MYHKAYGIIETLAPLHVGASSGEETGNLNLIFRDQFTQTGIIPGSSIRGRFRADMRGKPGNEQKWYGQEVESNNKDIETTEADVKFEYASIVWMPVFCPGQPVVWVSCPRLLKRYQQIHYPDTKQRPAIPAPYTAATTLVGKPLGTGKTVLFFNLGFLEIQHSVDPESLNPWIPPGSSITTNNIVVVDDNDMAMIHDMALYRQSRVKLANDQKKVANGAFFNVEALPEGTILIFPIALKKSGWRPFDTEQDLQTAVSSEELYFGGLESIGFGRCNVTLQGAYA